MNRYGCIHLAAMADNRGDPLVIKVLTFNIHHGRGMDGKLNLNRIAEVIKEDDADLIGLNEVDRCFSRRSGYVDQLSWLSETLNMNPAFGTAVSLRSKKSDFLGQYGNALLSRYPIAYQTNHPLLSVKGVFEGRALLEAEVHIQGQRLNIYVVHLSLSPFKQNKQIEYILKKLSETRLPIILLGDFNMRPGTKQWNKITNVLTDVCHSEYEVSCHTFPSFRPKLQLDYIFVSEHFHVESVHFIPKYHMASDHIPIKATIKLKR